MIDSGEVRLILLTTLLLTIGQGLTLAKEVPPLTNKPTGVHQQGRFLWYELFTESPGRSTRFYKKLFGWDSMKVKIGGEELTMLWNQGRPICAVIERGRQELEETGAVWVGYASVRKLEDSIAGMKRRGAEVLVPVTPVENRGSLAILVDPSKGLIGLFETVAGDPPDRSGRTSEWFWSQLLTVDGAKSRSFYQGQLGYRFVPDRRSSGSDDYLMVAQGKSRAGMSPHPDEEATRAEWLHFVRVDNIDATITKARKLGAKLVVDSNGEVAVLRDPIGALFGVIRYQEKGGSQ